MAEPVDEAEAIRRLIAEVDALPKRELPGFASWAYNHPGILTSRTKDPRQYDQDARRAYFLERVRRDHRDFAHDQGLYHLGSASNLESLRSPYQPYSSAGPLLAATTNDSPLANAGRLFQALPGAVYASGQMLANEMDPKVRPYPDAYDDYARNINNLAVFAEPLGVNKNHMRDMADMRGREAAMSWRQIVPQEQLEEVRQAYGQLASPKDGSQFLAEAGVRGAAGRVLGALMDATIDPFYSPARTLKGVAVDFGPGLAPTLLSEGWNAVQSLRPAY